MFGTFGDGFGVTAISAHDVAKRLGFPGLRRYCGTFYPKVLRRMRVEDGSIFDAP
jgi:hypothetical protein